MLTAGAKGRLPRKVLHVMNGAAGGASLSTLALIRSLRAHGVRSCVVCHPSGTMAERRAIDDAVAGEVAWIPLYFWNRKTRAALFKRPLIELAQRARTGTGLWSVARVAALARRFAVDLIHTNTIVNREGALAARLLKLSHVWHVRELIGPGRYVELPLEGAKLGEHLSRHASRVVANSKSSAACLAPLLPPNLLRIIPNGIEVASFAKKEHCSSQRLVVGMVGNLTSLGKRHELFLRAAKACRVDNMEFRIYGHDPTAGSARHAEAYAEGLHRLAAELGIARASLFRGFVSNPAQIMAELDILVAPSELESFGRTVIEAMAAGLPVVGVAAGGVAELVVHGETGFLATPNSAEALATAIDKLAASVQLREAFGAAGRRLVCEKYSIEATTARLLGVYEEALSLPLARVFGPPGR